MDKTSISTYIGKLKKISQTVRIIGPVGTFNSNIRVLYFRVQVDNLEKVPFVPYTAVLSSRVFVTILR